MNVVAQYVFNGLMLGMIYAMVAVGFTLFFGVLDIINFSHGDVLVVGAFAGLAASVGIVMLGFDAAWLQLLAMLLCAIAITCILGAAVARFLVLPLRKADPLNTLLATLMLGTVLREAVRLFYPDGSNPKRFPALLPGGSMDIGGFTLRFDSAILLLVGLLAIYATHLLITRTRLGRAIRAVAQDSETARLMGINFEAVVLLTFAIGSGLAALAGIMNGLYYNEINFNVGLMLGVIGFACAILGGLGSMYGAIIGGFLFAGLQVVGSVVLPALVPGIVSAYKDVFAFAVVIILMGWKPTGLLAEKSSERV